MTVSDFVALELLSAPFWIWVGVQFVYPRLVRWEKQREARRQRTRCM